MVVLQALRGMVGSLQYVGSSITSPFWKVRVVEIPTRGENILSEKIRSHACVSRNSRTFKFVEVIDTEDVVRSPCNVYQNIFQQKFVTWNGVDLRGTHTHTHTQNEVA